MAKKRTDLASIAFTWMLGLLGLVGLVASFCAQAPQRAPGISSP